MEKEDRTCDCEDDHGSCSAERTDRSEKDRRREEAKRTSGVDDMADVGHCTASCRGPGSTGVAGRLGQEKRGSEDRTVAGLVAAVFSTPHTENRAAGHVAITSSAGIAEGSSVEESF